MRKAGTNPSVPTRKKPRKVATARQSKWNTSSTGQWTTRMRLGDRSSRGGGSCFSERLNPGKLSRDYCAEL